MDAAQQETLSFPVISAEEAWQQILATVRPLAPVERKLASALGQVLAEDVLATDDMPPFPASAMDGYAVIAAEGAGPRRIIGQQDAGPALALRLEPGTAVRIMTGGRVPEGADAVIPVEDAEWQGDRVAFRRSVAPGTYIRPVGQDLAAGEAILAAGVVLGPAEIGLLATIGRLRVRVHPRPMVAVMATGNELVPADSVPGPGQIRDSNSHALCAAVAAAGFRPLPLGIVPDDVASLRAAMRRGLAEADMLLTSGGVSMGVRDLIKPLLRELGVVHFGRVAVKPGKPLTFATVGDQPVFGLPGFPVSSLVCFECFVRPALRRMAGLRTLWRPTVPARLTQALRHEPDRLEFQRAVVTWQEGAYWARTTGSQSSGRLKSLVGANALLQLPAGVGDLAAGEQVMALLIDQPEVEAIEHTSR